MSVYSGTDDVAATEVIRPSAVLSENDARLILAGLEADDVRHGGVWWVRVGVWRRYEGPWAAGTDEPGSAKHLGTISCVYDSPSRFAVTVFRASLTTYGLGQGWTVETLCDDAFRHANLTLASCPRAQLSPPPRPLVPTRRW